MGKNSRGKPTAPEVEMSSFQNFFNEDFLLSSSLKPKGVNVSNSSNNNTQNDRKIPVEMADEKSSVPEPKRVCVAPVIKPVIVSPNVAASAVVINKPTNSQFISSQLPTAPEPVPSTSQVNTPAAPSSASPHSLSDQILQVRIKLQIYQKEYAHFVECANRSSLQIQETLEELHRLVNLNFDVDSSKNMNSLTDLSSQSTSSLEPLKSRTAVTSASTPSVRNPPPPPPQVREPEVIIKSVKHRPRAFPRKPRCLIFNATQPSFADLMVTSSLDGSVQLWSKTEQKIRSSLYLPSYLHKPFFVEDLCWDREPTGLLALGVCESSNAPVNDDSNSSNSSRSDRQIAFLQFNSRDPLASPKFIYSSLSPHDRSISVIESWSSNKHSNSSETSHFLTGGLDKAIFSWKVIKNGSSRDPEISVRELHRRHTSSVQAICYDPTTSDIWSGGVDCRVVQWSSESNRLVNELRWDSRISHLIKSKNHPNMMLASVMSMSSQLRLFDTRINNIVHSFGTQETANLSRYVRPSWHPDGNLIANGTLSPADSVGSINIWDIRMMRTNNSSDIKPVKVINCEDRRLVRAEFAPDGKCLVGMSTDGYMTFVDLLSS